MVDLIANKITIEDKKRSITERVIALTNDQHSSFDTKREYEQIPKDSVNENVRVDVYDGPLGKGFVVSGFVIDENNIIYNYYYHYGPEIYRNVSKEKWIIKNE